MEFDFYYGLQSQTFSFYRIPKLLFTDSRFSSLSAEAKTLYGILLDRMDLSMKNGWLDKQNRVYLFFTVQEIQESLGCGKNKAIQLMKELEKMGLIERKRQGMGKPSFVYVKNILSCPESGLKRFRNQTSGGFKRFRNQTSGGLEIKLQEVGKSNPNHTDYSQTDNNETNLSYPSNDVSDHKEADAIRKREDYCRYFREELGIDELKAEYPSNADMIEELFELIVDTVCSSRVFIRIGKEQLPAEIVRSRMMKLNAEHIRYLIACLNENTTKIRDIRQYLLTALYNAPATISSYYNQLVQHDMAKGLI